LVVAAKGRKAEMELAPSGKSVIYELAWPLVRRGYMAEQNSELVEISKLNGIAWVHPQ
jgi:hypothetical protein